MLKLHNTLSRSKQVFQPITEKTVSMYVCGMTVYDFCHLGHARVMVVFDMVARWFRASGYKVTYVRNITDIDDKIIKRANENNESIQSLTQRFITAMDEDSAKLGIIRPDLEPRATEHVQGMLDMISQLIEKGFAYQASNGDVFYKVRSFSDYGKLSGKSLEDLRAGERVDVDTFKQDPLDFVLWKSGKPGEPYWESPWGNGRPGWHIECSVMSAAHLGQHFDIHGGGQDLQFPHHENEIAQSEATHGCTMANYWMHNGFIRVDVVPGLRREHGQLDARPAVLLGTDRSVAEIEREGLAPRHVQLAPHQHRAAPGAGRLVGDGDVRRLLRAAEGQLVDRPAAGSGGIGGAATADLRGAVVIGGRREEWENGQGEGDGVHGRGFA